VGGVFIYNVFKLSSNGKGQLNMTKAVIIMGLIFIMTIIFSGAVSAASYTVGPGSGYNYHSISNAVAVAHNGDNIVVYPNSNGNPYTESVIITHRLNISARGTVRVRPSMERSPFSLGSGASGSIIKGFNIINNGYSDLSGMYIYPADNCKIQNNNITGFSTGLDLIGSSYNEISYNNINSNSNAAGHSFGIYIGGIYYNNVIYKNIISTNGVGTGESFGIHITSSGDNSNTIISNNIITSNQTGSGPSNGIIEVYTNLCRVLNNKISSTSSMANGIELLSTTNSYITGNNIISSQTGIQIYGTFTGGYANFNRIRAVDYTISNTAFNYLNAMYNWYGSNNNPRDTILGNVNYSPWLILTFTPNHYNAFTGSIATITADLKHDSSASHTIHNEASINNLLFNVYGDLGTFSPITGAAVNNVFTSTFSASKRPGTGHIYVLVDYQILSASIHTFALTRNQLLDAATMAKSYYAAHGNLPSTVIVSGLRLQMPLLLQYMVSGLIKINNHDTNALTSDPVKPPTSSTGSFRSGNILKSQYLSLALAIRNYITSYHIAPVYATTTLGRVSYIKLVNMFSRIISYYRTYNALPNYVTMS
jgi:hypothetical protein